MTDLLVDDHAEVDALLRDMWREFDRGDARGVFEKLDYLWARLAVHIRAEHLHLFPALLAARAAGQGEGAGGAPAPAEVQTAVERLREDHDFFMRELAAAELDAVRAGLRREIENLPPRLSEGPPR